MKHLSRELLSIAKELYKRAKSDDPIQDFMNLVSVGKYKNKQISNILKKIYYVDYDPDLKLKSINQIEDDLEDLNFGTEADLLRVLKLNKKNAIDPVIAILKIRQKVGHLPTELTYILRFLTNPKLFKTMVKKGIIKEKDVDYIKKSKYAKQVFKLMDTNDYSDFAETLNM